MADETPSTAGFGPDGRKTAEEALRISEEVHRITLESISDAVFITDDDGAFTYICPNVSNIFGMTKDEVAARGSIDNLLPPDLVDRSTLPESSELSNLECAVTDAAGSRHDLLINIKRVSIHGGTVLYTCRDISERKAAEKQLVFQAGILNQIEDRVTVTDLEGNITYVNAASCRTVGRSREALLGQPVDIFGDDPENGVRQQQIVEQTLRDGEWRGEVVNYDQNGRESILDCRTRVMRDEQGNPFALCGVATDITERKRSDEALRVSEERFQLAMDATSDGLWDWNLAENSVYFSPGWARILGLKEVEPDYNEWVKRLHPDQREMVLDSLTQHLKGQTGRWELEHQLQAGRGEYKWVLGRGTVVSRDAEGRATRMVGTMVDISERKRTEEALRESEERFRRFVENLNDLLYVIDAADGTFTYISPNWLEMMGEPPHEAIGKPFQPYVHPEDVHRCEEFLHRVLTTRKKQSSVEYRVRHRDGRWIWHSSTGSPLFDEAGEIVGYIGVARDVTERRCAEKTLRESEKHFRSFFENLSSGVAVYDPIDDGEDFVFADINPAGERFSNIRRDEVRGKRVTEVFPSIRKMGLLDCFRTAHATGETQFLPLKEYQDERITQWVENRVYRLPSGRIVAVYEDRTKQYQLEERIKQMEKMDAIGQLAGGIAHDFNNQIASVMGYGDMLADRLQDPRLLRYANNILVAAHRAADLTQQLLAFARKGQYRNITINIHETIAETVAILEHTIDRRIEIQQILKANPPLTRGDPTQIQNALLNLALNARDAMPEGGLLGFETDTVDLDEVYCQTVPYEIRPGSYVRLAVTDTGCGMDAETRKHIFEPFFTTKEVGKGTGMGLAAVYGTLKHHHGAISVYSEPEHGSTFRLYLPLEKALTEEATDAEHSDLAPVRLSILVVDDEDLFRSLSEDLLQIMGHAVTTMRDGESALAWYRDHWREVDLVILDMIMPKLGGADTFRAMKAINPKIRAVLASGYSLNGAAQPLLDEGVSGFLQKPFTQTQLRKAIANAFLPPSAEDES